MEIKNVGPLTNISLFSGGGGLDLGSHIAGNFRTVCYVEFDIRAAMQRGVQWAAVEKSEAFKNICMMIQALVDQEVEAALIKERAR